MGVQDYLIEFFVIISIMMILYLCGQKFPGAVSIRLYFGQNDFSNLQRNSVPLLLLNVFSWPNHVQY